MKPVVVLIVWVLSLGFAQPRFSTMGAAYGLYPDPNVDISRNPALISVLKISDLTFTYGRVGSASIFSFTPRFYWDTPFELAFGVGLSLFGTPQEADVSIRIGTAFPLESSTLGVRLFAFAGGTYTNQNFVYNADEAYAIGANVGVAGAGWDGSFSLSRVVFGRVQNGTPQPSVAFFRLFTQGRYSLDPNFSLYGVLDHYFGAGIGPDVVLKAGWQERFDSLRLGVWAALEPSLAGNNSFGAGTNLEFTLSENLAFLTGLGFDIRRTGFDLYNTPLVLRIGEGGFELNVWTYVQWGRAAGLFNSFFITADINW